MRGRGAGFGVAAAVLITLVGTALLGAGTGSAAGGHASAVTKAIRVVSPSEDALVRSRSVKLVVRAPAGVRSITASLGNRNVSGSFKRRGRTFTARRRIAPGPVVLYVAARGTTGVASAVTEFVVGKRSQRLLRVAHNPRLLSGEVGVRARIARTPRAFRATLNRRYVHRVFTSANLRSRVARLDPDDGVRYGRNTLTVLTYRANGSYARHVRRFRVRRTRPLAAAGRAKIVQVGRAVRLDGRKSLKTRKSARLRYRWRVVRKPGGAKPKLLRATSSRPLLVPDRNGTYVLRLTVRERGRRLASTDNVTISGKPDDPPIGVTIDTIPGPGKLVTVAGAPVTPKGKVEPVQAVVVDRTSRAIVTTRTFDPRDSKSMKSLQGLIAPYDLTKLIILTGGARQITLSSKQAKALMGVLKSIGATDRGLSPMSDYGLSRGQWTVIGANGFPVGSANQNIRAYPGGTHGTLTGRLAVGSAGYTFGSADFVSFDTSAPGSTKAFNRMEVGSAHYDSGVFGANQSGLHVLLLDQDSLAEIKNLTIVTNSPGGPAEEQARNGLNELRSLLANARNGHGPPLIAFVSAIGDPGPEGDPDLPGGQTNHWFELASAIAVDPAKGPGGSNTFGGTRDVFTSQRGGYALVGGTNLPGYSSSETSTRLSKQPARLQGRLSRNRQSQWAARHWTLDGSIDPTMFSLAWADPKPWPATGPGYDAANRYITGLLLGSGSGADLTDFRRNYRLHPTRFTDGEQSDMVARLTTPGKTDYVQCPSGRSDFTEDQCKAVRSAFADEILKVSAVIKSFSDQQLVLVAASAKTSTLASDVMQQIKTKFIPPPKPAETDWYLFSAAMFDIGAEIGGEIPGVGLAFGLMSAGMEIASVFSNSSDAGSPELPLPDRIEADGAKLAKEIDDAITHTHDELGFVRDLMLSDPDKLNKAAENVKNGGWDFERPDLSQKVGQGLTASAAQQLWGGLLPLGYPYLHQLFSSRVGDHPGCGHNAPASTYYQAVTDYDSGSGLPDPNYNTKIVGTSSFRKNPTAGMTDPLFKPIGPDGGVGLQQPFFYQQNFKHRLDTNC